MLLMFSALLSGLLGLVRIKYINHLFGAGIEQDAYQAAFKLPDLLAYFLIGGAASISLITILNRYREAGDEEGGDRALSVILTTMLVVLGGGILLGEIFAPQYRLALLTRASAQIPYARPLRPLTRIILPAQLFFFIGSVMGSRLQVRKIFIYQAFAPLIYNAGIILGALLFAPPARRLLARLWRARRDASSARPAQLPRRVPHRPALPPHRRLPRPRFPASGSSSRSRS